MVWFVVIGTVCVSLSILFSNCVWMWSVAVTSVIASCPNYRFERGPWIPPSIYRYFELKMCPIYRISLPSIGQSHRCPPEWRRMKNVYVVLKTLLWFLKYFPLFSVRNIIYNELFQHNKPLAGLLIMLFLLLKFFMSAIRIMMNYIPPILRFLVPIYTFNFNHLNKNNQNMIWTPKTKNGSIRWNNI